ncbi:MAG: phosphoserine phosphatase SerB [Pseudomonadota bacterium]
MSFIVTAIANPDAANLDHATVMRLSAALDARECRVLAQGIAADFATDTAPDVSAILTQSDVTAIDLAVQRTDQTRRKRVLLADMDSTMIQQECIDELAAEVSLKDKVSEITARAMNGEIEFEAALRERVALLKGLPVTVIDKVIADRISLMPGGPEVVRTMRKHGAWCALVSGGFTDFTGRIAEIVGFQEHRANTLLAANGVLTGLVGEPILGKQAKVDALNDITTRLAVSPQDAITVGDGANDLGMLQASGTGVALHAKPSVAAQADIRIDHGDLTALLYIQGYTADEIVR